MNSRSLKKNNTYGPILPLDHLSILLSSSLNVDVKGHQLLVDCNILMWNGQIVDERLCRGADGNRCRIALFCYTLTRRAAGRLLQWGTLITYREKGYINCHTNHIIRRRCWYSCQPRSNNLSIKTRRC